ncbi:MAG: VCBS repeat-containing protein [Acidobacteria bacterium]|nr:VCBS repeat-containing protein [Acidobacteriota bacterium]
MRNRNPRFIVTTLTLMSIAFAVIWLSIGRASMNSEKQTLVPNQESEHHYVPDMIRTSKSAGVEFERRELFESSGRSIAGDAQLGRTLNDGTILSLDHAAVNRLTRENVEFLTLPLPNGRGGTVELELMKVNIFAPGFSVQTSKPTRQPVNEGLGVHYRGIVKGDEHSLAAISIFEHEVMGFYSAEAEGNNVIGRLGGKNETDRHIVYAERDMKVSSPFHCETKDDTTTSVPPSMLQAPDTPQANCVKIYEEANYDLYQNKGSVPAVNSFVTGIFNQSATLFNNDGISVVLSQIFVWNSPSPITGATTSSQQMDQFFAARPTFNGDVPHLLALQLALGGVARGRVCNNGHAISNIQTIYENVPTYSWSVECFTHETGHVLGSEHTHACFWNGNDTPIDGCGPAAGYPYEGGPCGTAPIPASGTIMSYCHLSPNPGINFANGFGPQPRAYIQTFIANVSCLTACGAGVGAGNIRSDFDGDRKTDVGVFRASNGGWYLSQSTAGFAGTAFGTTGDVAAPADYDGDTKTDLAVFRPSNGTWYLLRSQLGFTAVGFGANGDVPASGDFDGDDKADLAVFRPSTGSWYIQQSRDGFLGLSFGTNGDVPVVEDYDGDGRADVAVYRPTTGGWYIRQSALGFIGIAFGASGDKAAPADYDGDGKTDVAVFRPSNGTWYIQRSTLGFTAIPFGASGDKPAPGDYDGDGRADVAVFRPSTGGWYVQRSTSGFLGLTFGANGDVPTAGAYIP